MQASRFLLLLLLGFFATGIFLRLGDEVFNSTPAAEGLTVSVPFQNHVDGHKASKSKVSPRHPEKAQAEEKDELRARAEAFLRKQNYHRALLIFEQLLELKPEDQSLRKRVVLIYQNYATILHNEKEESKALLYADRGLELQPGHPGLLHLRAIILFSHAKESEDRDEQKEYAREALEANEGHVPALLLAAQIAEEENRIKDALLYYRRANEHASDLKGLTTKIERLQAAASVEGDFVNVENNYFVARFEGYAQERLAWMALNNLERAYFAINDRLNLHPSEKITVVIYTGAQFREALNVPDWSGGIYDGKIRIREGDLLENRDRLRDILYHEYVHALLTTTVGRHLPTWLNEGIAQIMEPGYSDSRNKTDPYKFLEKADEEDALFTLPQLQNSFLQIQDPKVVRLAYQQSLSLVENLVSRSGFFGLSQLLHRLQDNTNFAEVFEQNYFLTPDKFERKWRQSL